MSNSYRLAKDLELDEMSCEFQFCVEGTSDSGDVTGAYTKNLTVAELRTAIIKQIEVLSYFSDDPEEVLKRFNVNYGETE